MDKDVDGTVDRLWKKEDNTDEKKNQITEEKTMNKSRRRQERGIKKEREEKQKRGESRKCTKMSNKFEIKYEGQRKQK